MKHYLLLLLIFVTVQANSLSWNLTNKITSKNRFITSKASNDFSFDLNYQPNLSLSLWTKSGMKLDTQQIVKQTNSVSWLDSKWEGEIDLELYRSLIRFSDLNYELRLGLQQLNFGQALILRPLQWFDNIDPREESRDSDGVYAFLAKKYFLNNANLWGWIILDDDGFSDDYSRSNFRKNLEYGGRWQFPLAASETGFSLHHKRLEESEFSRETKLGFDIRRDIVLGVWTETNLSIYHDEHENSYANLLTVGADYTISVGNGLYLLMENLFVSDIKRTGYLPDKAKSLALQVQYPLNLFDSMQSIATYDWQLKHYNLFFSYGRSYDYLSLYLNLYWNEEEERSSAIEVVLETKF